MRQTCSPLECHSNKITSARHHSALDRLSMAWFKGYTCWTIFSMPDPELFDIIFIGLACSRTPFFGLLKLESVTITLPDVLELLCVLVSIYISPLVIDLQFETSKFTGYTSLEQSFLLPQDSRSYSGCESSNMISVERKWRLRSHMTKQSWQILLKQAKLIAQADSYFAMRWWRA